MIRAEWAKENTMPSAPVDDARFLRRVYIDMVGTIPPPEVVTSFALDAGEGKRARMVDTLLASPAYAEHWATYWTDVLIGQAPAKEVDKATFQRWLAGRFAANTPWNQIAMELLTAQGQNGEGGPRGPWAPSAPGSASLPGATAAPATTAPPMVTAPGMADEPPSGMPAGPVNPPVNWFVKYNNTPQDLAGNASRVFLGVQIQCAQCHDHKTEKWKQEDFRSFTASFMRTRVEVIDKGPAMGAIKRANVVDVGYPLFRYMKNPELAPLAKATPKALDGTDLSHTPNPRQALAAWMTSPKNPWFAEAFVNRMWGHFLGRGFVNPIDDIRPSNPATAPEVLAKLSDDFVAHGCDIKRLARTITGTEVYQLSSAPRPQTAQSAAAADAGGGAWAHAGGTDKLWARFRLEPLGPEELLNALMDATGVEGVLRNTKANVERIRAVLFAAYSYLFDVDEEFDQTDFEGTVSQALALLNGRLVGGGTSDLPGSALDRILVSPLSDADKIAALYLRTVSRRPTPEELAYFVRYVNEPHSDPATPDAPAGSNATPASNHPILQRLLGKGPNKKKGQGGGGEPEPLGRLEERDARNQNPKRRAYEDVFWELLNSSEFTFNH
jgi:Protein of unknown function (DUF1553)/Protein of unknown function (DUF1549)